MLQVINGIISTSWQQETSSELITFPLHPRTFHRTQVQNHPATLHKGKHNHIVKSPWPSIKWILMYKGEENTTRYIHTCKKADLHNNKEDYVWFTIEKQYYDGHCAECGSFR